MKFGKQWLNLEGKFVKPLRCTTKWQNRSKTLWVRTSCLPTAGEPTCSVQKYLPHSSTISESNSRVHRRRLPKQFLVRTEPSLKRCVSVSEGSAPSVKLSLVSSCHQMSDAICSALWQTFAKNKALCERHPFGNNKEFVRSFPRVRSITDCRVLGTRDAHRCVRGLPTMPNNGLCTDYFWLILVLNCRKTPP